MCTNKSSLRLHDCRVTHCTPFNPLPSRRKHPVLLQGPTSSGKTSLVGYLAAQTGHKLIRINNHEHTDLQVGAGQGGSLLCMSLSVKPVH